MGRPVRIFVLIDALGWRCLEKREFLSDVLPYRRPLRTVLGYSSGAIPTLLTGRLPVSHGHWNLLYYDPARSPFRWLKPARWLPDAVLNTRVTRKLLKEVGRRLLGLGALFECTVNPRFLPYFDWMEKKNIYRPGGITGAPSIFDRLVETHTPHCVYSYHDGDDAEILARARHDVASGRASFFFIYLSQMDSFLHLHRHEQEAITERLAWYERGLREVVTAARALDAEARVVVTSDHGMALVSHYADLAAEVEGLGLTMPDDYLAVYDSTMARFWLFSERGRREIPALLSRLACGRLVADDELRDLGIWFDDQRFGQVIFLLHPQWLVARSDFNGPGWLPAGMHGYHPDDPDSDAIFLSDRAPRTEPKTILDLYDCMNDSISDIREASVR